MNNSLRELLKTHIPEDYNLLLEAVNVYEKILNKDYIYKLENGNCLKVYFTKKDFHHLIGLHKLIDIAEVDKRKKSTINIYKDIREEDITYSTIKKSKFLDEMHKRLTNFQDIEEVIYSKVIIDFDKSKVRSSYLKGDVLLYKRGLAENKILSLISKKKNPIICTPETFIVQQDDYYFKEQIELKVVDFSVVNAKNKKR